MISKAGASITATGKPTFLAEPDLLAKVYFDARMVEVREWTVGHRDEVMQALGGRFDKPLDTRWVRNMMLSKWLDYLLDNGQSYKCHRRQGGGCRFFLYFFALLFCFSPTVLGFNFSSRSMKKLPAGVFWAGF